MNDSQPQLTLTLLKPTDVAAQLGVSRSWLYEAAKSGRIPSIRIGREDGPLRFVPEDIQNWLDDARANWTPGRSTDMSVGLSSGCVGSRRRGPACAVWWLGRGAGLGVGVASLMMRGLDTPGPVFVLPACAV